MFYLKQCVRPIRLYNSHIHRAKTVTTWSHLANHFNSKPEDDRWAFLKCERTVSTMAFGVSFSFCLRLENNLIAFRMFRVFSVFPNWNHPTVFIYFKKMSHNVAMNLSTKLFRPIDSGKLLKCSMNCRIHYAKWPIWRNLFGLRIHRQNLVLQPKKHASIFAKLLKGTIVLMT